MSKDKTVFPPPVADGFPAGAVDTQAPPRPPTVQESLQRFYPIDGDYFVLRMSEALTLNVQYMKLESEPVTPPSTQSTSHLCGDDTEAIQMAMPAAQGTRRLARAYSKRRLIPARFSCEDACAH